jgi:hypothetical protein
MFKYLIDRSITLQSDHESGCQSATQASPPTRSDRRSGPARRSMPNQGGLHLTAQPAKPPKAGAARPGMAGAASLDAEVDPTRP